MASQASHTSKGNTMTIAHLLRRAIQDQQGTGADLRYLTTQVGQALLLEFVDRLIVCRKTNGGSGPATSVATEMVPLESASGLTIGQMVKRAVRYHNGTSADLRYLMTPLGRELLRDFAQRLIDCCRVNNYDRAEVPSVGRWFMDVALGGCKTPQDYRQAIIGRRMTIERRAELIISRIKPSSVPDAVRLYEVTANDVGVRRALWPDEIGQRILEYGFVPVSPEIAPAACLRCNDLKQRLFLTERPFTASNEAQYWLELSARSGIRQLSTIPAIQLDPNRSWIVAWPWFV